ncbi:MAG: MgtC/SapB family protein, partial [Armatimonadetes bacterium]|nr:MgtC/SapB family protein [Armatimonadota bacterium]
ALFTILSVSLAGDKYDPARVAANIVTGIGFLGAGTIMRHGSVVHGLTTAASVWTAAAVGMACGLGWYPIAIVAATMVVFILAVLRPAAVRLRPEEPVVSFALTTVEGSTALLQIAERLEKLGARLVRVHLEPADNHGYQQVLLTVAPPSHMTAEALASSLGTIDAVTEVRMLGDG